MEWIDDGIVIARRKHGESALIVKLLTVERGVHGGLVRGGTGTRARAVYQIGNRIHATWRARLADHLGHFQAELTEGHAAGLLDRPMPLAALGAAASLIEATLPEREPNGQIFQALERLLARLPGDGWAVAYAEFELALLAGLGFGLDLESCALTGVREDLAFVSPRTGRAVARGAAGAYENRLFILPAFLVGENGDPDLEDPDLEEVAAALRITGHFLTRQVLAVVDRQMPMARTLLYDGIMRKSTISSGDQQSEPQ